MRSPRTILAGLFRIALTVYRSGIVFTLLLLNINTAAVSAEEAFTPPAHWLILGDSRSVSLLRPQNIGYLARALENSNILPNIYAVNGGQINALPPAGIEWLLDPPVPASPTTVFLVLGVNDAIAKVALTDFSLSLEGILDVVNRPTRNAFTGKVQRRKVICVDLPPSTKTVLEVDWPPYAQVLKGACPKLLRLKPLSKYYASDGIHLTQDGTQWLISQLIDHQKLLARKKPSGVSKK